MAGATLSARLTVLTVSRVSPKSCSHYPKREVSVSGAPFKLSLAQAGRGRRQEDTEGGGGSILPPSAVQHACPCPPGLTLVLSRSVAGHQLLGGGKFLRGVDTTRAHQHTPGAHQPADQAELDGVLPFQPPPLAAHD